MRVERIVLEYHRKAAVTRLQVGDVDIPHAYLTFCDFFQPGNHAQQSRFAAAGWSH